MRKGHFAGIIDVNSRRLQKLPDIKTVDDAEADELRDMPWQPVHRFVVREQTQADRIFGASQNSGDNPGELMSRAKGKPGTASRFSKQS